MDQIKIGQFIAYKRKEKKLTQEQLAERLGVTNKAVSKWENGKCMPDLSNIQTLCEILGVSVTTLLSGEENKTDDLLMKLLWVIERLKKLRYAIIGLLICNVPYAIEEIKFIADIPSGTFLKGFADGAFAGLKIVGMAIFAYGIIKYIQYYQYKKTGVLDRDS